MPDQPISHALQLAWQIAGDFALQAGAGAIEPQHMLYGIASLEKQTRHVSTVEEPEKSSQLQTAITQVEQFCARAGLQARDVRHRIREQVPPSLPVASSPSSRTISRSAATKKAFAAANRTAAGSELGPVDVLKAILELGDSNIERLFSIEELRQLVGVRQDRSTILLDRAILSSPEESAIGESLDASVALSSKDGSLAARLIALSEISWQFGAGANLEAFLQEVLRELLRAIPHVDRASVLLLEENGERLLLKAHLPDGTPTVSLTSVLRAMQSKSAFIWRREGSVTVSQQYGQLEAGIYAPLVAQNEALGVLCLDSSKSGHRFSSSDLSLAVAVTHQLALAISNFHLQEKLETNARVLERLLTNFSPKLRKRLLERAQQGKLRLGGERSSLSILCSDIRGFTRLSASIDAEDLVEMLNDYFLALTECIFRNEGTVDKFVGDAILAVFGSPDPDPRHHHNAVKAALEMQAAMRQVNERRAARGQVVCEIGVGVHTGDVLHGFIGSPERMEYTIIGEAVNRTARLCDGAKATEILISPEIHQYVWNYVSAVPVTIGTKHEGDIQAYRVEKTRDSSTAV